MAYCLSILLWLAGAGLQLGQPPRPLEVVVSPPRPAQGGLVLVELRGLRGQDRVGGRFGDRPLRFFADGRGRIRALAAVPVDAEPGPLPLRVRVEPAGAAPMVRGLAVPVRAGRFDEQPLRVEPKFVRPPPAVHDRIERERQQLQALWRRSSTRRKWSGSFSWPRRDTITSAFGLRRMFNGQLRSRHLGLDIDGKVGQPVRAIGAGRVVLVARRYYAGGTVVIDHGLRLFSLYFHLSRFAVEPGQAVARGQRIGSVGRSGRVTGPHLHLATRLEDGLFDPRALLDLDLEAALPGVRRRP